MAGLETWMLIFRNAGMTSCLPGAKPVPCPPCRPRPTASVRGRCEAASTEATDLQAVPKGAIHNAPLKTERSLITLTRPAVVQPGHQGLASHVQWRRNRNGRFTHCRPLTNDLGHGHGVGGSADGYLGTNTTPHTVILDKASSATAPPRNGTRASRLDSATSSALYEPTRLALSGTTRRRPIIGKFPEATILTLFTLTTARAEAHIPQSRYSGIAAPRAKTRR